MAKRHGSKKGSRSFWRRQRAHQMVPRMRSWSATGKGLAGFVGYKAGMAHVVLVEDRDSPYKNQEITRPVTFIETPPILVFSVVGYKNTLEGLKAAAESPSTKAPKQLSRALTVAKKPRLSLEDFEKLVGQFAQVRVMACTQPWKAGVKATPDVFELGLNGRDAAEQFAHAKNYLGKEVGVSEVFGEGEFLDVIAVTTGKGWGGVVERYGVALNPRKATGARRHGGTLGPERQGKIMYTVPRAGQTGFHRRTERNKRILKLGAPKDAPGVSPAGGFQHYGILKSDFVVVDGSIPGPVKRPIRLRRSLTRPQPTKPDVRRFVV